MQKCEEQYLESFIGLARKVQSDTVQDKVLKMKHPSTELIEKLREFNHLYNIQWPLVHLRTADII